MPDPDRYLDDFMRLAAGELVEIDPQDPASLAAFRDVAELQQAFRVGDE